MSKIQKTTALYKTPFSAAYWRDALAEVKDVKILVFTALMIAVRVAMKPLNLHLAPGLQINTAFLANAVACMVIGPVMAIPFAIITDTLGCIIFPQGPYFLPMVLPEIAGSLLFALLLYRAQPSSWRVILSRFLICFLVNVLLTSPLMVWYYSIYYPKSTYVLDIPRVIKNLFMFPLESLVLVLLLKALAPVTSRMGLTCAGGSKESLRFQKKDLAVLLVLFVLGTGFVFGYLTYHYNTTSLSASYDVSTRVERNQEMLTHLEGQEDLDPDATLTVVESAKKPFLGKEITYTVAVYAVKDGSAPTEAQWKYSKSKAAKDTALERVGTVTLVLTQEDDTLVSQSWAKVK